MPMFVWHWGGPNKLEVEMEYGVVLSLIEKSLRGELSLDELHNCWTGELKEDDRLKQVFEDLEDAVEHIPGYWFKDGVNLEAFAMTAAYKMLLVHREAIPQLTGLSDGQVTVLYARLTKRHFR